MAPGRLAWLLRGQNGNDTDSGRHRASSTVSEKSSSTRIGHPVNGTSRQPLSEKQAEDIHDSNRGPLPSLSAAGRNPSTLAIEDAIAEERAAGKIVRTIPAWVRDAVEDDLLWRQSFAPPTQPGAATIAQHNHTPATRSGKFQNHGRNAGPYLSDGTQPQTSRWVTFARASAYPREPDECENVSAEWLDQNFGDYSTPWLAGHDEEAGEDDSSRYHAFRRKRRVWYRSAQVTILQNPFVPLGFRLIIFVFCAIALSVAAAIHEEKDPNEGPSAKMAIVVDVFAMIYTVYITVDEYISKPLGLRSVRAKLRLMFLDLLFIVLGAANLALAMEGISHGQGCGSDDSVKTCHLQKALAGVLQIVLVAWLVTFAISLFRLIERVVQS